MRARRLIHAYYWAALLALTVPLAVLAITSVTDASVIGFPLSRPSLRWYAAVWADPESGHALLLSGFLAVASASMAVGIATWIALAAGMLGRRWRWAFLAGTMVPLVTPGIVHAISLRIAAGAIGLDPGPLAVLFGHTLHATPLAVLMLIARLETMPADLIDAARDLGAGPVRSFGHVQLPWLGPAPAGAFVLAALTSFDDFIRSFFLSGYDATLPVLIFGRLHSGLTPALTALVTLVMLVVLAVGLGAGWVLKRDSPRDARV